MSGIPTSPYPTYRPSGAEWLALLPEHWKNSTLGFECSVKARLGWRGLKAEEYVESGYIFLATPNIKDKAIDFDNVNYITKERYEESPEIMLEIGDVLVTKDGSTTGTTNLVRYLPGPATVNSSIAILRSFGRLNSGYLYHFFTSDYVQNVINRMRGGMGVPHLFQADLRKFFIPIPPLEEQTQIAKFLDYETAKIDALIAKQQQLIALLQEKRQAVISHAVTKGLNPDAPLRDSGVEWLGMVPAHWRIVRLKHTCKIQSGMPKGKPSSSTTVDMPMLRVANVQDGWLNLDDVHQIPVERSQVTRYLLRNGDVLMNEGGDRDKLGRGTIWRGEVPSCIHQNHVFAIRPHSIEPEWIDAVTRADYAKFYFYQVAKQSTNLASISSSNIMETPLVVPPLEERRAILAHIRQMSSKNSSTIGLAECQVELLQERRTALISAAVTGKIDVRGWQPPLATPAGAMP